VTISSLGQGVGAIALYAVIGLALMLIGFSILDLTTPGKLSKLVRDGRPNAAAVTAAGLLSMAFIVVVAIFNSPAKLSDGIVASMIFGVVGILAQVIAIRVFEFGMRINVSALLAAERFSPVSVVLASAHLSMGLVVAVAIS